MTEKKWTPGPWSVVEGSESGHCCFDYSIMSPQKRGIGVVAEVFCGDAPDAHLIAAAPELYDALEALFKKITEGAYIGSLSPELGAAFEAMRKARGEA